MKKIKILFIIIALMIMISGISVYAVYKYKAEDIKYREDKSVEEALNELYSKNSNIKKGEIALIWENQDTTAGFIEKRINYDLSQYTSILIQTLYSTSYRGYYEETQYSLINIGTTGHIMAEDDNVAFHAAREVMVSNSEIYFGNSYYFGYNLPSNNNTQVHAIPLKIYAIK